MRITSLVNQAVGPLNDPFHQRSNKYTTSGARWQAFLSGKKDIPADRAANPRAADTVRDWPAQRHDPSFGTGFALQQGVGLYGKKRLMTSPGKIVSELRTGRRSPDERDGNVKRT